MKRKIGRPPRHRRRVAGEKRKGRGYLLIDAANVNASVTVPRHGLVIRKARQVHRGVTVVRRSKKNNKKNDASNVEPMTLSFEGPLLF